MVEENRRSLRLDLRQISPPRIEPSFLKPQPGKLQFPNGEQHEFTAVDLLEEQCIGIGAYGGVVTRMVHAKSGQVMAVKRVRAQEVDPKRRDAMLRELRIIIQSQNCEDIVRFYGALFHSGDCWICMELMDCSLDKFYPLVYLNSEIIPERVIGIITASEHQFFQRYNHQQQQQNGDNGTPNAETATVLELQRAEMGQFVHKFLQLAQQQENQFSNNLDGDQHGEGETLFKDI